MNSPEQNDSNPVAQTSPEVEIPEVTLVQAVPRQRRQMPRIVFAAVLGLLIGQAGVIGHDLGSSARSERVYLDMQAIAGGLRDFSLDGQFEENNLQRVSWLYGPGLIPNEAPFESEGSVATPMADVNTDKAARYIQILMPDPWGNAYLANVDGLQAGTQRIKVLSAGPDGTIETSPSETKARGDDVLIHLF
jgi:hypothetical protein